MENNSVDTSISEINKQAAADCVKSELKKNPWEIDDREELFFKIKAKQNKKNQNDSNAWKLFGKTMGL